MSEGRPWPVGILLTVLLVGLATLLHTLSVWLRDPTQPFLSLVRSLAIVWGTRGVLGAGAWAIAQAVVLEKGRLARWLAVHVLGCLLYNVVYVAVMLSVPGIVDPNPPSLLARGARVMLGAVIINLLVYWGVVGAHQASYYLRLARDRERTAADLATRLAEARLETLRAQLNPHFLFNAINSITSLALSRDTSRVVHALGLLADLLRRVLVEAGPVAALDQEVTFASRYLELQQMRLGTRLTVHIDVDAVAAGARVPAMILQPVVENAVVHGIEPEPEGGRVTVQARRAGERLRITVHDTGGGQPVTARFGIGLAGVEARLQHCFGTDFTLSVGRDPSGGTVCTIDVPFGSQELGNPPPQNGEYLPLEPRVPA